MNNIIPDVSTDQHSKFEHVEPFKDVERNPADSPGFTSDTTSPYVDAHETGHDTDAISGMSVYTDALQTQTVFVSHSYEPDAVADDTKEIEDELFIHEHDSITAKLDTLSMSDSIPESKRIESVDEKSSVFAQNMMNTNQNELKSTIVIDIADLVEVNNKTDDDRIIDIDASDEHEFLVQSKIKLNLLNDLIDPLNFESHKVDDTLSNALDTNVNSDILVQAREISDEEPTSNFTDQIKSDNMHIEETSIHLSTEFAEEFCDLKSSLPENEKIPDKDANKTVVDKIQLIHTAPQSLNINHDVSFLPISPELERTDQIETSIIELKDTKAKDDLILPQIPKHESVVTTPDAFSSYPIETSNKEVVNLKESELPSPEKIVDLISSDTKESNNKDNEFNSLQSEPHLFESNQEVIDLQHLQTEEELENELIQTSTTEIGDQTDKTIKAAERSGSDIEIIIPAAQSDPLPSDDDEFGDFEEETTEKFKTPVTNLREHFPSDDPQTKSCKGLLDSGNFSNGIFALFDTEVPGKFEDIVFDGPDVLEEEIRNKDTGQMEIRYVPGKRYMDEEWYRIITSEFIQRAKLIVEIQNGTCKSPDKLVWKDSAYRAEIVKMMGIVEGEQVVEPEVVKQLEIDLKERKVDPEKGFENIVKDFEEDKIERADGLVDAKAMCKLNKDELLLKTPQELEDIKKNLLDLAKSMQDQAGFWLDAKEQLVMDAEMHNKMIASLVGYAQQQQVAMKTNTKNVKKR